ncbi:hypothetical protein V6N12_057784 [Hibiscus sabdariffa]|uniref:Uncharacterized protein n=1 Tax=Hibiscus sabdariffa TaxID=183260 RepID=A0ABR1ZCW1_9ROSI
MPIADHVVSFPVKSEEAIDGRGITGLFGSMFGKLSSLERIDRQAALHAVTIKEIRVEISESSPLHPYISSLSLAKKSGGILPFPDDLWVRLDPFLGRESDLSLTLIDGVAGKPPPIILLSSRFTLGREVKSSESTRERCK